ncbi:hypothetical protein Tco_1437270 [Tanacetum coccineum]
MLRTTTISHSFYIYRIRHSLSLRNRGLTSVTLQVSSVELCVAKTAHKRVIASDCQLLAEAKLAGFSFNTTRRQQLQVLIISTMDLYQIIIPEKVYLLRKALYGLKQAQELVHELSTSDIKALLKIMPDALIHGKALLEGYSSLVMKLVRFDVK